MYNSPVTIECCINENSVYFEVDSGAAVSVLTQEEARRCHANIVPTNRRVLSYNGGSIYLVGEILLPIVYNNNCVYHNFLIADGNKNNLFGRDLFTKFDVHIIINPDRVSKIAPSVLGICLALA